MAKILIIDDQAWVLDLCREGLAHEGYQVSATDDIEYVRNRLLSFRPNLVLLNQYLKHGFVVWDVLSNIKMQAPHLPVLIVTEYDTHLFCSRLSQADGFLVRSQTAADELREKVSALLDRKPAGKENDASPLTKLHLARPEA